MVAKRTLEDGIAILRFVAESDAVKHMRDRIREGASRVADNDRMPRIIAGSAGILAALLSETEGQDPQPDYTYDASKPASASSGVRVPSIPPEEDVDEDDEDELDLEEVEALATVRDLEDEADLASPPDGEAEDADDDEEHRLPYEEHEEIGEGDFMVEEVKPEAPIRGARKARATPKGKEPTKKKVSGKASKSANAARGAEKKAAGKRGRQAAPAPAVPAGEPPAKPKRKATAKPKVVKRPTEKAARRTEPPPKKSS